ncbi:MAG: hypothetical protein FJ387_12130 [Verrucomicrobia bacterium]|nr:hypothetical protein [Verrucomicrobiota bacterium]
MPWQPLTLGGVAGFARTSWLRLVVFAYLASLLVGAAAGRSLYTTWYPALDAAIPRLPARAEVRHGRLLWPAETPVLLADNSYLALVVNPAPTRSTGQSADVQFEFRPESLDVSSLLGYVSLPYPAWVVMPLDRMAIEPWWGAWRPHALAGAALLLALALVGEWWLLGLVLALPLRVFTCMLDRAATVGGCWRLGTAAFIPGALLLALGLLLYSAGRLSLADLLLVKLIHLACGLLYAFFAPFKLPPYRVASPFTARARPPAPVTNPFGTEDP